VAQRPPFFSRLVPARLSQPAIAILQIGLALRCQPRKKDGKVHDSWKIVESRRVGDGRAVQRQELCLGEINASNARLGAGPSKRKMPDSAAGCPPPTGAN